MLSIPQEYLNLLRTGETITPPVERELANHIRHGWPHLAGLLAPYVQRYNAASRERRLEMGKFILSQIDKKG